MTGPTSLPTALRAKHPRKPYLDNWNHLYSVGRDFGTMTTDVKDREIFVMTGKYGSPENADENFFTDPNPYLV